MPLWGKGTSNRAKPKWLNTSEREKAVATSKGWEIIRPDGTSEILAAIKGLDTSLGVTTVANVAWGSRPSFSNAFVLEARVSYTEKIVVTGVPQINALSGNTTLQANVTLSSVNSASYANSGLLVFRSSALDLSKQRLTLGDVQDANTVTNSFAVGEAVFQVDEEDANTFVGTVFAANSTTVSVNAVTGNVTIGTRITGATSAASANVTANVYTLAGLTFTLSANIILNSGNVNDSANTTSANLQLSGLTAVTNVGV